MGLEPTTTGITIRGSTIELQPPLTYLNTLLSISQRTARFNRTKPSMGRVNMFKYGNALLSQGRVTIATE